METERFKRDRIATREQARNYQLETVVIQGASNFEYMFSLKEPVLIDILVKEFLWQGYCSLSAF